MAPRTSTRAISAMRTERKSISQGNNSLQATSRIFDGLIGHGDPVGLGNKHSPSERPDYKPGVGQCQRV